MRRGILDASKRPAREEVLRRVRDKEGLVCLLTEKVDEGLLRAAPKLRIAANVAVGFDNIDVAACTSAAWWPRIHPACWTRRRRILRGRC